jgi:hypothetical protein
MSQVPKIIIIIIIIIIINRTIPNSKRDIIIRDNETGTCMLIDVPIPGDRNVIKKEAENILKYKDLITEIQRMWNVKNTDDASNNRGNWNHFKILQKILEHIRKARYQGTAENSCNGHSTHTAESANVEAQQSLILQTALYAPLTVRAE